MLERIGETVRAPPVWLGPLVVGVIAAVLRLPGLDALPSGFHGDEAFKGLLAARVLDEGYIGPYTRDIAGMPLGPVYVDALFVALLGKTIVAIRLGGALAGVATVVALYLVLRQHIGGRVPFIASLLLAVLCWHLHFTRTGFPISWWPLVVLLLAHATIVALRGGRSRWWVASGALAAIGMYVYNGHTLVLALTGLFAAGYWLTTRQLSLRRLAVGVTIALAVFTVLLVPLIRYAAVPANEYFRHFREASVLGSDRWQSRSLASKVDFALWRYLEHWDQLSYHPDDDLVDGTGATILVPPLLLYLAAVGMLLTMLRDRRPVYVIGIIFVLLLPLGTVFTEGGAVRRALPIAPFLATFAAVAIDRLFDVARDPSAFRRRVVTAVAVVTIMLVAAQNLSLFFRDFADPTVQRFVLAEAMTDASQYIDSLPAERYVYFYSERWSFDYSIRSYLAPDARGEDRSREFGVYGLEIETAHEQTAFILLGPYRSLVAEVQARYPGGTLVVGGPEWNPTFVAYLP